MLDLVAISNPRTANGVWEDESGCSFCGAISCGYIGISVQFNEDSHLIQICGSCILCALQEMHRTILKQCEKRV